MQTNGARPRSALGILTVLVATALLAVAPQVSDARIRSGILIPSAITTGPGGNLWFTQNNQTHGEVVRLKPNGTLTHFRLPGGAVVPQDITTGPDGNLWLTEVTASSNGAIVRVTPHGAIHTFTAGFSGIPRSITRGPGSELWFTETSQLGASSIGRITTTGVVTEFPAPVSTPYPQPYTHGITAGPDGNIWFTEGVGSAFGGGIGRITPSGTVTDFSSTAIKGQTAGITVGRDGALWFTELNSDAGHSYIGRITTRGVVRSFPIANHSPLNLTTGSDGNLWVAEHGTNAPQGGGQVLRFTPKGKQTAFPTTDANDTSNAYFPADIVVGPDKALWFTEDNAVSGPPVNGAIGRLRSTARPVEHCVVPTLYGDTLGRAKRQLRRAHCALGKVRYRKAGKGQRGRVLNQSEGPNGVFRAGARISVTLGK